MEEIGGDAWSRTIDLSGQFRAPLFNATLTTLVIAGVLLVPLALRLATKARKHEI